ncbi:MAG: LicD family protein [Anaerotruncus sp.]|nr:LicD family protein [Anaerotruncus sp.]
MENQEKLTLRYQRESLDILLEFQRVCEKSGLCYYLTAGTLLGAIRHKGFIPWDDDIDVAMPRQDYDRLVQLAPQIFSEKYVYQEYRTEPNFPFYFAKLRKRGTIAEEPILRAIKMEQGCYIDVFPLDWCPDKSKIATLFFKGIELLNCAILARVSTEFVCKYKKYYMRLLWSILKRFSNRYLFFLREVLRNIAKWMATGKKLCTVGGSYGYPKEVYCSEWWERAIPIEFEGYIFPAPAGWDMLLQSMYGEYMVLPPEKERRKHFI